MADAVSHTPSVTLGGSGTVQPSLVADPVMIGGASASSAGVGPAAPITVGIDLAAAARDSTRTISGPALPAAPSASLTADAIGSGAAVVSASPVNSHMTITLVDAPGTTLSSAAQTALNAAASYLDTLITNPIDVTIGVALADLGSGVVAEGGDVSYGMSVGQVESHIAAAAPGFTLPSLPAGVSNAMYVSKAEELAWGLNVGSGEAGSITISNRYDSQFNYSTSLADKKGNPVTGKEIDFVGVMLHELTHALGRVPQGVYSQGTHLGALDLFDYTANGRLAVASHPSLNNLPANYFSVNGGATLLRQFEPLTQGDPSDWQGSSTSHDAFNSQAPYNYATLSSVDATLMNALGFSVNYAAVPCFAEGTRLLTERGSVKVEDLAVGDRVILACGDAAPVRWIGRRRVEVARHPEPASVMPVLIRAGAIADGVPARDLRLSPDHAVFLDGHLIPAKALINLASIRQVPCEAVVYFHVELPTHAVLLAEGLPAESYLDTGNRAQFVGQGRGVAAPLGRETASCAPLVEAGPVVEAVRARILARAGVATTVDPDLRIDRRHDGALLIRSRRVVPGFATPDPRDRRRLGVKIAGLASGDRPIPLDHPALAEGWHDVEADGRWTDGCAVIPPRLCAGPVEVSVAATLTYPLSG